MIETNIAELAASLLRLEELKGSYSDDQTGDDLESEAVSVLANEIEFLRCVCWTADFDNSIQAIKTTQRWLKPGYHTRTAGQSEITHVVDAVYHELEQRKFFHLPTDRAKYFDHEKLFGDDVYSAFPPAIPDVRESGNCLAMGRNTAAVFHLMRSVEWGLRALCGHLGLHQARRSRKGGTREYIPLAYADWETMLNQIHPRVDARINKLKRGTQKQTEQEFYYPVLQDIRGIRDAWRNHVMHTRAEYNPTEAETILNHVERIMRTLATRFVATTPKGVSHPRILSAKYGLGGVNYLDVTQVLRGYVKNSMEVFASNHFFTDPYPNKEKHLVVQYSMPPSRAQKTVTIKEGQPLIFTK